MNSITDVCRLCLATDDLVSIFDRKLTGVQNTSLKDVIFTTSGVEIYPKDFISQKICTKCCQISMKMFQFREQSLKNDKYLKNQYAELLKNSNMKLKIPNTNITITAEKAEPKKEASKPQYRIHPSVTNIFKDNPQIRLPSVCLRSNIAPCVSLEMNAVEKYFRSRNLDFQKYSQLAMRNTRKVAVKKGSAKPVSKPKTSDISKVSTDKKEVVPALPKGCTKTKATDAPPRLSTEKTRAADILTKVFTEKVKAAHPLPKESTERNKRSSSLPKVSTEKNKAADPLQIVPSIVVKTVSTRASTNADSKKNSENTTFRIVNVSQIVDKDNPKSSDDSDSSIPGPSNKRKLPRDDSSPERNPKKPAFIECLGLTPKKNLNSESAGKLYLDKSVPLFICNICNSVQYNAKDLKKHMLKHLRCQFCKLKFKTMDTKLLHIEKFCRIKNMMNALPVVELEKIEYKLNVRNQYPDTFADFPSIPGLKSAERNEPQNEETLNAVESSEPPESFEKETESVEPTKPPEECVKNNNSSVPEVDDIIEILSDDEGSELPSVSELPTCAGEKINASMGACFKGTYCPPPISETPISAKTSQNIRTKAPIKSSPATLNSGTVPKPITGRIPVPIPTIPNNNVTPSYIVKPDIKIKNVSLLDSFDPKTTDTKVVTELLTQLGLQHRLHSEKTTQTDLPSNNSIKVNGDLTTELRNLRHMLLMYKVPVHITQGDFNVHYNYQIPAPRQKKLCFWNDLVPFDLKKKDGSVHDSSSKTKNSLVSNNINPQVTSNNPFIPNSAVITQQPFNVLASQSSTSIANTPLLTSINTGNPAISAPVSSGLSCVLPQSYIPYNQNSSSVANPTYFNTVTKANTSMTVPGSSGISYVQPPSNISYIQNNTNASGATVFSNVNNGMVMNTSGSSGMNCMQPSSSISFSYPTSTQVQQLIAPTSVNTFCVQSTNSVTQNYDSSRAVSTPFTVQDSVPASASLTPISAPLMPVTTSQSSSTNSSQNVIPSYGASEANGVPVAERGAIRVKNLCELT